MRIRGIHHVGLVVDDLDAAVAFWSCLLEAEVIERDRWRSPAPLPDQAVGLTGSSADGVMLRGSGSYLELWRYYAPTATVADPALLGAHERGLRHVALEVDDVTAVWHRVQELGGTAMGEPVAFHGATVVYCRDPFGTIIELVSFEGDDALASLKDLKHDR